MYTACAAEGFTGTTLPMPSHIPAVVHGPGRSRSKESAIAAQWRWLCGRPTSKGASADVRPIAPTADAVGWLEMSL